MSVWVWIVIAVALVIAVAATVWTVWRRQRTDRLRQQFGSEYDRTVKKAGGRLEAESELEARSKRREQLEIRPLDPSARDRYATQWRETQARFVDSPQGAVAEADTLVAKVMSDRGYPMEDFEVRASDISVDHPEVVENYRRGHDIAERNLRRSAPTEELRQAMVHYRALFDELLADHAGPGREDR